MPNAEDIPSKSGISKGVSKRDSESKQLQAGLPPSTGPAKAARNLARLILLGMGLALLLTLLFGAGCSRLQLDGYIVSYTTRTIGLDVSADPKTQVPHARLGFFSTSVHYLPTGKTAGPVTTNITTLIGPAGTNIIVETKAGDASEVPALMSDIEVKAGLTMQTIDEQYATGVATIAPSSQQLFQKKLFKANPSLLRSFSSSPRGMVANPDRDSPPEDAETIMKGTNHE
jgi:hypothetical protein